MFKKAEGGKGNSVIYYDENGDILIRREGTRSWRNNNPGNIRASGFSYKHGAIGSAGGFAIFPSYQAGRQALAALLMGKTYSNLSLYSAIQRYAPPSENNTSNYRKLVQKLTGLDLDTKIKDLNVSEFNSVLNAIQRIEGYRPGKEEIIKRSKVIDTERGDGGALEKFRLEGKGWKTKSEIIQMTKAGRIINAVYVRSNGSSHVRSRPDQTESNNFATLADD